MHIHSTYMAEGQTKNIFSSIYTNLWKAGTSSLKSKGTVLKRDAFCTVVQMNYKNRVQIIIHSSLYVFSFLVKVALLILGSAMQIQ